VQVDHALLHRLHRLRLVAPTFASGHRYGERRARATGHGMEFSDYRHYHAGDDLRRVDWNAWTRLGTVLVRLFHEDRNLRINIHLDASGSMSLGQPRRLDFAGNLALALAGIGLVQRDTVRLGCFGAASGANGSRGSTLVSGHDLRSLGGMMAALSRVEPGTGAVDMRRAILGHAGRRRADRSFLISDLLVEEDDMRRVIRALAATGSRPALLHVLGPEERDPDLLGTVELVDAETGQRRFLDVTPATREAYRAHVAQWLDSVQRLCGRYGVQYLPAYSDGSLAELMTQTLRRAAVVE
jgi:uncharacterized protein (DUF58 family)